MEGSAPTTLLTQEQIGELWLELLCRSRGKLYGSVSVIGAILLSIPAGTVASVHDSNLEVR